MRNNKSLNILIFEGIFARISSIDFKFSFNFQKLTLLKAYLNYAHDKINLVKFRITNVN